VGKVFVQHFESGGTFLNFKPEEVRAYYQQMFKEGEKAASIARAEAEDSAPPKENQTDNFPPPTEEKEEKEEDSAPFMEDRTEDSAPPSKDQAGTNDTNDTKPKTSPKNKSKTPYNQPSSGGKANQDDSPDIK
jgi:hypothetical protein